MKCSLGCGWILHWIFQLQGLPRLIFKGGTSLSKALGIISRFSEDIDSVINRHELGFNDESDPANQPGARLRDSSADLRLGGLRLEWSYSSRCAYSSGADFHSLAMIPRERAGSHGQCFSDRGLFPLRCRSEVLC